MGQEQVGPGERGQPSSHDTGTSAGQVALAVQFSELAQPAAAGGPGGAEQLVASGEFTADR